MLLFLLAPVSSPAPDLGLPNPIYKYKSKLYNILTFLYSRLKLRLTPKRMKFHAYGAKLGNRLIRVGKSYLNAHAFTIGLADSPQCNCGANFENSMHIMLTCPLYESERRGTSRFG